MLVITKKENSPARSLLQLMAHSCKETAVQHTPFLCIPTMLILAVRLANQLTHPASSKAILRPAQMCTHCSLFIPSCPKASVPTCCAPNKLWLTSTKAKHPLPGPTKPDHITLQQNAQHHRRVTASKRHQLGVSHTTSSAADISLHDSHW